MILRDALILGRVSNLPTVWTNTLVGLALAGGAAGDARTLPLLLALSLFYLGGMYLNDAFDAAGDAVERPERPIPSGRVGRGTVFALGFAMLGGGLALLLWLGLAGGAGYWPAASSYATHLGRGILDFAIGHGVTLRLKDPNQLEVEDRVSDHISQFFSVT